MRWRSAIVPVLVLACVGLFLSNPSFADYQKNIVEPWADRVLLQYKSTLPGAISEAGKALPTVGGLFAGLEAHDRAAIITFALDNTRYSNYLIFSIFDACAPAEGTGERVFGVLGRFWGQPGSIICPQPNP